MGAFLSIDVPVVGVGLETDDEGEGLGVKVIFFDGTGLDQVSLAFGRTVLAGERPAGSVLNSLGISIGEEVEVADFPEVLAIVDRITLVEAATLSDL